MSYFDDIAASWDDDPRKQTRARHTADAILAAVPIEPAAHLLDFGGGTGMLGALLASRLDERGHLAVLDASGGMIEAARATLASLPQPAPSTSVIHAEAPQGDMDGAPFDVIVSSLAFHHIHDIPGTLRALGSVCAPGGTLVICELDPDPEGAFHRHNQHFDGHHGINRESLQHQVLDAGFGHVSFTELPPVPKDVDGHEHAFPMFMLVARWM